ncbi:MAG: CopD family protein [Actinomycetes bacterium]
MSGAPRPSFRAFRWCGALVVASVALAGPLALPAAAHADVVEVSPGAGAVLTNPPRSLAIQFTEGVAKVRNGLALFDGAGRRVPVGRLRRPGPDRLVLAVRGDLPDGTYIVTWRAVSDDTHTVEGTWTFRVGTAAVDPGASAVARTLLDAQRASPVVTGAYGVLRWLAFAALAVLIGGAVSAAVVWPPARRSRVVAGVVSGAAVTLVLGSLAGIAVFGASVRGGGVFDVVRPGTWRAAFDTRFGAVWLARAVLAAGALVLGRVLFDRGDRGDPPRPLPRWWCTVAVVVGVGLVCTPGLAGHAGSDADRPLALVLDAVHVAAMAVWVGGLVVLLIVLGGPRGDRPGRRSGDAAANRVPHGWEMVGRFSRVAWWCVAALVASGALRAWRLVGGLEALRTTDYGRTLVVKLVVVALLLAVAVRSRDLARRESGRTDAVALRRSVGLEVVLAAVVLVVTAVLVEAPPPAGRVGAVGAATAATTLVDPRATVDLTLVPGRVGVDDLQVVVTRRGAPLAVAAVEVTLTPPSNAGAPILVPLRTLGPGHSFSPGLELPLAGRWRVLTTVVIGSPDQPDRITLTGTIIVAP